MCIHILYRPIGDDRYKMDRNLIIYKYIDICLWTCRLTGLTNDRHTGCPSSISILILTTKNDTNYIIVKSNLRYVEFKYFLTNQSLILTCHFQFSMNHHIHVHGVLGYTLLEQTFQNRNNNSDAL